MFLIFFFLLSNFSNVYNILTVKCTFKCRNSTFASTCKENIETKSFQLNLTKIYRVKEDDGLETFINCRYDGPNSSIIEYLSPIKNLCSNSISDFCRKNETDIIVGS
jgi:hypothetical protein